MRPSRKYSFKVTGIVITSIHKIIYIKLLKQNKKIFFQVEEFMSLLNYDNEARTKYGRSRCVCMERVQLTCYPW